MRSETASSRRWPERPPDVVGVAVVPFIDFYVIVLFVGVLVGVLVGIDVPDVAVELVLDVVVHPVVGFDLLVIPAPVVWRLVPLAHRQHATGRQPVVPNRRCGTRWSGYPVTGGEPERSPGGVPG